VQDVFDAGDYVEFKATGIDGTTNYVRGVAAGNQTFVTGALIRELP